MRRLQHGDLSVRAAHAASIWSFWACRTSSRTSTSASRARTGSSLSTRSWPGSGAGLRGEDVVCDSSRSSPSTCKRWHRTRLPFGEERPPNEHGNASLRAVRGHGSFVPGPLPAHGLHVRREERVPAGRGVLSRRTAGSMTSSANGRRRADSSTSDFGDPRGGRSRPSCCDTRSSRTTRDSSCPRPSGLRSRLRSARDRKCVSRSIAVVARTAESRCRT